MADRVLANFRIEGHLGLGTDGDAGNKLAVKGAGSLFDNEGAGHQIKVNKAAAGDTGSFLFQTGFSGRAEFGLLGNNDFTLKTSANGSAWFDAFAVAAGTGVFDFKQAPTYLGQALYHTGSFDIANYAALTGAAFTGNITNTGVYRGPAGTGALPAFAFSGDPDTGVFSAGANQLGLAAGGAVRATLSTTALTLAASVTSLAATSAVATLSQLGLGGATPDATNRLSINTPSVLLNRGTDTINVTLNKQAAANDARFTFQTNFSTRALFGTLGADDFSVQVSPDGAAFNTALTALAASGDLTNVSLRSDTLLRDNTDRTKAAQFVVSGITTGTTRAFTFPNFNGTLMVTNQNQTVSGAITFSNTVFNAAAATTASLATATTATTVNLGSGATTTGVTKTLNLGTGGASGSTTNINIGSATSGALGTTTFNSPTTTFGTRNTTISILGTTALTGTATNATLQYLGLGGATADATNRFSINTPALLLNNAGSSVEMKFSKNATANDAALTFQNNFSTHAIMGLLADNNFTLKVSPNGSTYNTAFVVDNSGRLGLGNDLGTSFGAALHLQDSRTFQPQILAVSTANNQWGPYWNSRKSRNGNTTNVNDDLGTFIFQGNPSGGGVANACYLRAEAEVIGSTWVSGAMSVVQVDASGAGFVSLNLLSNKEVRFPSISTTANAANVFLDTNNGLLKSTSSEQYKTSIEDMHVDRAYEILRGVKPIWYRSLAEADRDDWSWYGFSAENVASVDPRLASWVEEEVTETEVFCPPGVGEASYEIKGEARRISTKLVPDGVGYDRFVVVHAVVLKDLVERVNSLEKNLRP